MKKTNKKPSSISRDASRNAEIQKDLLFNKFIETLRDKTSESAKTTLVSKPDVIKDLPETLQSQSTAISSASEKSFRIIPTKPNSTSMAINYVVNSRKQTLETDHGQKEKIIPERQTLEEKPYDIPKFIECQSIINECKLLAKRNKVLQALCNMREIEIEFLSKRIEVLSAMRHKRYQFQAFDEHQLSIELIRTGATIDEWKKSNIDERSIEKSLVTNCRNRDELDQLGRETSKNANDQLLSLDNGTKNSKLFFVLMKYILMDPKFASLSIAEKSILLQKVALSLSAATRKQAKNDNPN